MRVHLKEIFNNVKFIQRKEKSAERLAMELIREIETYHLESSNPFLKILEIVINGGLKTIIVEKEYVDEDFLDVFSTYYSKLFSMPNPHCIRLHFFSTNVDLVDLVDLSDKTSYYQGYCVIRPIHSFQVSRTVLKSPHDDNHSNYTLCKATFEANLSGNKLSITGMPFVQQDTNVCICAEASMWMMSFYMHKRFGFPRLLPSKITDHATKTFTVGRVREGLVPEQVLAGLREMGYEPSVFLNYDKMEMARIIYGYIESEIPVMLLIQANGEGHAVTAIGHDYHVKSIKTKERDVNNTKSSVDWIKNFIVHDDAVGPYMKMAINAGVDDKYYTVEKDVVGVIVPSPSEVKMQIDDVLTHIETLFSEPEILNSIIGLFGKENVRECLFAEEDFKSLVFRTYLQRSNDFKANLPIEMDDNVKLFYSGARYPKYIWVTEISRFDLLNSATSGKRKRNGEIIIDSTADRHTKLDSYLFIHFNGRMIIRAADGAMKFYKSLDEVPYPHLVRKAK